MSGFKYRDSIFYAFIQSEQSIMTTFEVIFSQASLKLNINTLNLTGSDLLSDRLKRDIKTYLLLSVLEQCKTVFINLSYYNVKKQNKGYNIDKILQLWIIAVQKKVQKELFFLNAKINYSSSEAKWLLKNLEIEDGELFNLLLNNLFENNSYEFIRDNNLTKLMSSILENLVIKLTEILTYLLLIELALQQNLLEEVNNTQLVSIHSQKNNLYWQSYLRSTFFKPKYIYTGVYILKTISKYGVCNKVAYLPILRWNEKHYLSSVQFAVLLYFELLDFIVPKFQVAIKRIARIFKSHA